MKLSITNKVAREVLFVNWRVLKTLLDIIIPDTELMFYMYSAAAVKAGFH